MGRFYEDEGFEFAVLIALGSTYRGLADVGEVLATVARIPEGDRLRWVAEFEATADRLAVAAQRSLDGGHPVSARSAWLRASLYFDHASAMAPGTERDEAYHQLWERQRECWDSAIGLFDPPIEKVAVPFEGMSLEGYVLKPDTSDEPRPWVILNNGSDGPVASMWSQGGAAAVERGWCALAFDGPGQGATFHRAGIPFRPDWETVVGPVVDWLDQRSDVDRDRIVLHGVSQAGYWVPRAAAFEHRLAAIVADPGVVDVSASWLAHLPPPMIELLEQGEQEAFDDFMGANDDPTAAAVLAWRMAPYGTDSPYEAFTATTEMRLDAETVGRISCPTLVLDPEGEQFWPGQSAQLYDLLQCPKALLSFTAAEGADWHCEPAAQALRDERVFDWLEAELA